MPITTRLAALAALLVGLSSSLAAQQRPPSILGTWHFDLRQGDKKEGPRTAIDPTKVTRTAPQNAASIAGPLLTTECVVVEKKEDKPAPSMPPGGGISGMY